MDNNNKPKNGMSVEEIEKFGKKHTAEIFLGLYIVLSTLMTFVFFGAVWSVFLAGLGAILGMLMPEKIEKTGKGIYGFVHKQEKITRIVLGVVGIIVSFFLPPLIFFFLGLNGGCAILKRYHSFNNLTK